jgi:amidase
MARTAEDLRLLMEVLVSPPPLEAGYWNLGLPMPTKHTLAEYKVAVWGEQPGFPVCTEVRAAVEKVTAALQRCGATVDTRARPDFDGLESHRLYLQLLGCTNTCKEGWKAARVWEQQHRSTPAAEARLAAASGHLWEIDDSSFVVEHSVSQTFRQFYAANERRNALRTKWAEFFREGQFDAVLMPVYPLPAIVHDHTHEDVLYPHCLYGPYWRPSGRTLAIDGVQTPYQDAVFWSGLATVAYLPSTAFPTGCGKESGLPIGLQLVGPEGADYLTIALAGLLETEAGFRAELPPVFSDPDRASSLNLQGCL